MYFGVTGERGRSQQSDSRESWSQWQGEDDKPLRRTRAGRPLRDRRYRRVAEEMKQTKRLFTPEIKKFLKGWLVRRRKNPYPNRAEKKELALQTGLTYMQICNWFANWRRKLKKCSRSAAGSAQRSQGTWGPLIAGYNRQARGNVEQFSISSDDSIWDEANYNSPGVNIKKAGKDPDDPARTVAHPLQPTESAPRTVSVPERAPGGTPVLLKWLESAARFRPREACWTNPAVSWSGAPCQQTRARHRADTRVHHREELDAAEALTFLSTRSALRQGQCV